MNLDCNQKQFSEIDANRIRLLAPAGSGKTLSLLYRCKRIFENERGVKSRAIIFSFTRVACVELESRLANDPEFSDMRQYVTVTTLNK